MKDLIVNVIYISVAIGFIGWVVKDFALLLKNKKIEDRGNVYRLNVPDREKRMLKSMFNNGDYKVVNEYLHHYEFIIDNKPVILGIASIVGIIEDLEK
tara:strand:+ start:481 stop:774 length:294 start_codon:yes stop_codon:yes gene_type:complete